MISTKDKIGYIQRLKQADGSARFRFIESKINSVRIGKTKTSVYTDRLYVLDAEEIEDNTAIVRHGDLLLVNSPFITTDEYSDYCKKCVDYWNEHGVH